MSETITIKSQRYYLQKFQTSISFFTIENSTKLSQHTNLNSILSQIYRNSTAAKKDIIVQCCLIKMSTQIKHDKTFLPRITEFDLNAKKKTQSHYPTIDLH